VELGAAEAMTGRASLRVRKERLGRAVFVTQRLGKLRSVQLAGATTTEDGVATGEGEGWRSERWTRWARWASGLLPRCVAATDSRLTRRGKSGLEASGAARVWS
jgi:hypothetical protein